MRSRLHWVAGVIVLAALQAEAGPPERSRPADGVALQTILDLEQTARLLAILLDSGRSVINENQALFDDPGKADKGFTPEVFERQLARMFRDRSGLDVADLDSARVPSSAKKWLKELLTVSKQVVKEAQADINQPAAHSALIPAVFGSRVAGRFTERTGVRLKQTALAPRNPANAPDAVERSALELFAAPDYPREKSISEATAKSGMFRLMYPLYMTRQCLDCHGEPKGTRDKMGYLREGLHLGQNAGAISVGIQMSP
jgi:general secretion pathway protein A